MEVIRLKQRIVFIIGVFALFAVIIGVSGRSINPVAEEVKQIAEENGLENVSIDSSYALFDGWWNVTVKCSNYDKISNSQKYDIDEKLNRISNVYIKGYESGGATYTVYSSTRSIYKNGKEIDDDFYNSDSYKSLHDNKPSVSSGNGYSPNREKDAWVCEQDIVNSNLKAPATAKFCSYTEAAITHNGGSDYTVKGYVDAENSYGAKIRTYFTVTLTLTEKGYTNGYVTFS